MKLIRLRGCESLRIAAREIADHAKTAGKHRQSGGQRSCSLRYRGSNKPARITKVGTGYPTVVIGVWYSQNQLSSIGRYDECLGRSRTRTAPTKRKAALAGRVKSKRLRFAEPLFSLLRRGLP